MARITRHLALVLLLLSAVPMLLALLAQYGFGLHPCELCLWQRVPLVLLIAIALFAWRWPSHRAACLILSALLWCIEAGLAAYHVGVEQQWWRSATGCSTGGSGAMSLEVLRAQIMGAPLVSCDVPELVVLGLSMAGWNVFYALACVVMLGVIYKRYTLNSRIA